MAKQLALYIDANRGIFFGDDLQEAKEIAFPDDIVRDLDLVNKEKLDAYLQAILQTYQIIPSQLTIILADAITFDKDVTELPPERRDEEIKKYLDIVPFQDICSRVYTIEKKAHLVAANNSLIEKIRLFFQKQQFIVTAVVPYSILQEVFPALQTDVDLSFILSKIDSFKQYSIITEQSIVHPTSANGQVTHKGNKRLFLLVGVFGILIAILIVVIFLNLSPQQSQTPAHKSSSFNIRNKSSVTKTSITSTPQQAVAGASTSRRIVPTLYFINVGAK